MNCNGANACDAATVTRTEKVHALKRKVQQLDQQLKEMEAEYWLYRDYEEEDVMEEKLNIAKLTMEMCILDNELSEMLKCHAEVRAVDVADRDLQKEKKLNIDIASKKHEKVVKEEALTIAIRKKEAAEKAAAEKAAAANAKRAKYTVIESANEKAPVVAVKDIQMKSSISDGFDDEDDLPLSERRTKLCEYPLSAPVVLISTIAYPLGTTEQVKPTPNSTQSYRIPYFASNHVSDTPIVAIRAGESIIIENLKGHKFDAREVYPQSWLHLTPNFCLADMSHYSMPLPVETFGHFDSLKELNFMYEIHTYGDFIVGRNDDAWIRISVAYKRNAPMWKYRTALDCFRTMARAVLILLKWRRDVQMKLDKAAKADLMRSKINAASKSVATRLNAVHNAIPN